LGERDITKVQANAANSALAGGGGVDGAIHRHGGPTIMEECRKIEGCPTRSAVATMAGRLPAKYVFHAKQFRELGREDGWLFTQVQSKVFNEARRK